MRPDGLRRGFARLLDIFFPTKCVFCRKIISTRDWTLCPHCQDSIPWLIGPQAEGTGEFYKVCVSPLFYEGKVRKSIHRYKFNGLKCYASTFGPLMAQCVTDHLAGEFDLITWVPLSEKRLRKRGYDQARLLAEAMGRELDVPVQPLLKKPKDIVAQSSLKADESSRRANVLGAYQMIDTSQAVEARVLVVDDVVTTSSTLSECARVLRTAGAPQVVCVTLARAKK